MKIEETVFALCLLSIIIKDKYFDENAILLAHKIEIRLNKGMSPNPIKVVNTLVP